MLRFLPACCLALLIVSPSQGQSVTYEFDPDSSKISIDGTSNNTPHWTVYATEFSGSVTLNAEGDSPHTAVESATLTVPTKMIKSGKSGIMDRVMYDALDVNTHPEVTFTLTGVSDAEVTTPASATLTVHGELTLYGQTNEVSIPVEATRRDDGMVVFQGSHTLTLKDYGMKPPTAMFGSLRTGQEVTVTAVLHAGPLE